MTRCPDITNNRILSTQELAHSLYDLIEHYKLSEKLITAKYFQISVNRYYSNWPILSHINYDPTWPVDYVEYFIKKYPDKIIREKNYKEMLSKVILSEDVYFPIVQMLKSYNCELTLSNYISDPLFLGERVISRSEIVKKGIWKSAETQKDVYPYFMQGVDFLGNCLKDGKGQNGDGGNKF